MGFGASPTRSPPRPNSALLNTGTFYAPSYQLPPLTISPRLYEAPFEPESEILNPKKYIENDSDPNVVVVDDDDSIHHDEDDKVATRAKKSSPKKKNRNKKNAGSHGAKLLGSDQPISRKAAAIAAAEGVSKVSRVKPVGNQNLTRRVKEEVLPPVRRGGGAFTQEIRSPLIKRKGK